MKTTKISGYTVQISACDDAIGCWIEKGDFHASLSALEQTEVLENRAGREHKVKLDVIEEIVEWAEANGY